MVRRCSRVRPPLSSSSAHAPASPRIEPVAGPDQRIATKPTGEPRDQRPATSCASPVYSTPYVVLLGFAARRACKVGEEGKLDCSASGPRGPTRPQQHIRTAETSATFGQFGKGKDCHPSSTHPCPPATWPPTWSSSEPGPARN